MPFTPSHAVVALPFVRTPLVPAAIAVGAMTPDLPLFLRGTPLTYQLTHTNVIVAALLAAVLLALWWMLLRPAVRELSPAPLARRLPGEWDATGRHLWAAIDPPRSGARNPVWRSGGVFALRLALSLVLGVITHIVWDAFTHEGRWGVALFPALDERWGPLLGYKWLQYGSSVGGLLIIAVFAALWLRRRTPERGLTRVLPSVARVIWWLSLPVILIAAWIIGLLVSGGFTPQWTPQHLAYRVLPPACAIWGMLTVAMCVWVRVRRR